MTKTLEQLMKEWVETYPEDKNNPDLEQMATAGMVKLKCGTYILPLHYEALLKARNGELPTGEQNDK